MLKRVCIGTGFGETGGKGPCIEAGGGETARKSSYIGTGGGKTGRKRPYIGTSGCETGKKGLDGGGIIDTWYLYLKNSKIFEDEKEKLLYNNNGG